LQPGYPVNHKHLFYSAGCNSEHKTGALPHKINALDCEFVNKAGNGGYDVLGRFGT
jgi:hypothetical protein